MSEEPSPIELARSAASNAAVFASNLAERLGALSKALREGNDAPALIGLGESTEDLEYFLTFLVLISELIETPAPDTFAGLQNYRSHLVDVLSRLQPALDDLDLVEVADALEHDIVTSLSDYQSLDPAIRDALQAAA